MTARRFTLCHTGDWHLGHTLHRRSREREHARFLAWLAGQLEAREADALVIAGDVFDTGSPPGTAQSLFYSFLADVRRRLPSLVVVVVAGNHDAPARLSAPDPLLAALGVRIVGTVPYDAGELAADRLVVPVTNVRGETLARIAAVPFLRASDLPAVRDVTWSADAHASGVREVYERAIAAASAQRGAGEALVATGHFAAAGARMSRDSERLVFGGADGTLPIDVVPAGVDYLALGHLHLAQEVPRPSAWGEKGEARYAGSPIPLAFSERTFVHEVRFVSFTDGALTSSEGVTVPRTVPFVRIPAERTAPLAEIVAALHGSELSAESDDDDRWPWVEVRAHVSAAERDVASRIREAAEGRRLHLVKVTVEREAEPVGAPAARSLDALDVRQVFLAKWREERAEDPADAVLRALDEATDEARGRLEARSRENGAGRAIEADAATATALITGALVAGALVASEESASDESELGEGAPDGRRLDASIKRAARAPRRES